MGHAEFVAVPAITARAAAPASGRALPPSHGPPASHDGTGVHGRLLFMEPLAPRCPPYGAAGVQTLATGLGTRRTDEGRHSARLGRGAGRVEGVVSLTAPDAAYVPVDNHRAHPRVCRSRQAVALGCAFEGIAVLAADVSGGSAMLTSRRGELQLALSTSAITEALPCQSSVGTS